MLVVNSFYSNIDTDTDTDTDIDHDYDNDYDNDNYKDKDKDSVGIGGRFLFPFYLLCELGVSAVNFLFCSEF